MSRNDDLRVVVEAFCAEVFNYVERHMKDNPHYGDYLRALSDFAHTELSDRKWIKKYLRSHIHSEPMIETLCDILDIKDTTDEHH